ncbi:MAG: hypothetical protein AAGF12_33130, partial [Myxococcota bacterium]
MRATGISSRPLLHLIVAAGAAVVFFSAGCDSTAAAGGGGGTPPSHVSVGDARDGSLRVRWTFLGEIRARKRAE